MLVVLVEPEVPGNIGAVARIMKNFGFKDLVLINPKCDYLSPEAIARAKHGLDVLENAKVLGSLEEVKKEVDVMIATTGKIKSKWEFRKRFLTAEEVAKMFYNKNIALVFGRESIGLTNDELAIADVISWIPASEEYPILNLSHAVGIYLYEFFKMKFKREKAVGPSSEKIGALFRLIEKIVSNFEERRRFEREEMVHALKNIFLKANFSDEDLDWIFAFLRRIERILELRRG